MEQFGFLDKYKFTKPMHICMHVHTYNYKMTYSYIILVLLAILTYVVIARKCSKFIHIILHHLASYTGKDDNTFVIELAATPKHMTR